MNCEDEELSTYDITLRPKAPGPRAPLPRMMNQSMQQSKLRPLHQLDDDNESADDSESDTEIIKEPIKRDVSDAKLNSSKSPIIHSAQSTSVNKIPKPRDSTTRSDSKLPNKTNKSNENSTTKWIILCVSVIILVAIPIAISYGITKLGNLSNSHNSRGSVEESKNVNDLIVNFETSIDDISHRFKNQYSYTWDEIFAGVVDIIKHPKKRSVIFMFSNDDNPMFCLAKMVANATKAVLHTDDLYLTPADLGNDYGLVIDKFEKPIQENRIVIIENLLDIDTEAMRALHNLCDSENPLVSQTIYIFTMIANGYENDQRPIDFVEKQLKNKLEGRINSDKVLPLIARITDAAIIPVQPEPDITSCPLRY